MGRFHIPKLFFVVLFLLEISMFCLCKNTSFDYFERERQALLNLKKSFIKDPLHILSSWEGIDYCKWKGVSCSTGNGHVVKLDLHNNFTMDFLYDYTTYEYQLVARDMNPSLLDLKYLIHLDLSGNDFQGSTIPEFFGLMKQLEYLNLNNGNITGMVPRQLGNLTNLRVLDLHASYGDELSIEDLNWVSRLKSLRYVDISGINLSGARNLMQVLNMLPSLLELRMSYCMLNDNHLPRLFVNSTFMSAIQHLDLSRNLFSQRPLPIFLKNMTSLRVLHLSHNSFNSSIPLWLSNLKNIVHLDLAYNQFNVVEGGLSMMLWNHCHLKSLNLSDNMLEKESLDTTRYTSGCIGHDLEELKLDNMGLTGHFPDWLSQFKQLKVLVFSSNSFNGTIPALIGNLSALRYLSLNSNQLSGVIPATIGNLSALTDLYLSYNQLSGVIPATIGNLSAFDALDLSFNQLNGVIPATIGNLPALDSLDLSSNQLNGVIPTTIGNLSALDSLDLSSNKLNGAIPATIGNLSALADLHLSFNLLNGVIPTTIGKLSALDTLVLTYNQLNGVIPATIGNLSALRVLDLSSNQLNRVIPESLGQLSNLESIYLGSNSLEGALSEIHFSNLSKLNEFDISLTHLSFNVKPEWVPPFQLNYIDMSSCKLRTPIPQWLETQKEVYLLYLANARISGPLPNWLWSMQFSKLDLSKNRITGSLPRDIADTVPTLEDFSVADNLINGTIPTSFCKIDTLISLDLSNNMLSGDIPNCWSSSNRLNALKLSFNKLTGVIPNSIGHLIKLEWLHLKNNRLGGEVPLSLRNCRILQLLNLGENKFSGNLPTWIGQSLLSLQILRLQKNMFNGYIPRQLCQLATLKVLDLAANNLSGTIPQCFENFSGMVLHQTTKEYTSQYFQREFDEKILGLWRNIVNEPLIALGYELSIDLSDNNLTDMIPEGLTILSGLIRLNLSHNHLTGNIPKGIGNLTSLEYLDFSGNQLSGNIPTNMLVLTSLSHLNLSYNNFSGKIPTGPQLQTLLDPSIYAGNLELCGAPLPKRCPGDEPSQAPIPDRHEENDEEDKSEKVWFYTFPVLGYITGLWGVLGVLLFKKSWRYAYFQLADNVIDWIYVRVAIKAAWLKKKMAKNHASN